MMKMTEARRIEMLRQAIRNIEEIKSIQDFIDQELKAFNKKAA
ncbi:hypothetical protein [Lelliottia amnigena]|nr:hypothetical protein [Lelliottia amnigena]